MKTGIEANDPWYSPPSIALQQQFLLDLQGVEKGCQTISGWELNTGTLRA